ncbi:MAG: urea ABC transporter permease subunit UrtB [Tannerellaceae bacterium]|nr:urea ABC transporter permease subunit UrtB [Tannerellaceae bacterium]
MSAGILPVDSAVTVLQQGETEKMTQAVEALTIHQDPATFPLIEAVLDGRLHNTNGEVVKLTRTQRLAFNKILPVIYLTSPDTEKRKQAYLQLASARTPELLPVLKEQAGHENDPELAATAIHVLRTLQLFSGDEADQAFALEYFSQRKTGETNALLEEYLQNDSLSATNRNKAQQLSEKIVSKQKFISVCQNLFSGLSLGSILFLVALGLSIIYGLAGIINMSHGEFIMIGAYTTYCIQQLFINYLPAAWLDISFFLSLPMAFVVTGFIGLILERLVIRHLYGRPQESLLATWGISLILIQIARNIFGDLTAVKSPAVLSGGWMITDDLMLPYNRLFIIALSAVMFLLIYLLFQKTRLGIKIRSVTQNRQMSACVGISTNRIDAVTFVIGSGLAGVAGCAITLIGNVVPNMGQTYIVDSFLVVVIGGVGKLVGCVVSGLGIGVLSKFFEAGFEAVYGKVLMLVLIIIFLQYKPKGLFPDKGRIGDD